MSRRKKIWNVTWRIVVCAILLGWIFNAIFVNEAKLVAPELGIEWEQLSKIEQWETAWQIGPPELWKTVSSVQPFPFAISVLLVGVTILIGVIRWRMVLEVQGLHLSFVRTTEISFVAHFFNSFLLGSTGGDLMKAYYAARETHHKKTEAVTTVFVDRLVGLWTMLFFAAVMMLPNLGLLMKYDRFGAAALLILGMFGGCSILLTLAFWGGVSKLWPAARRYLRKIPKAEIFERSLDACRQFGPHKSFLWKSFVLSMALNAIVVLQVIALAKGLGLAISPKVLFMIVPIIICISALPITPSGLGVRENLFVLMLAAPEIYWMGSEVAPMTSRLSLSLLMFAGSLFWSLVGGVVYLCLREKQHLREIAQAED
ncbi:MAG: flippase-like domain-containing protein [Verrucomicrobia bacterium]|nr:flippase-like domain-containing protein [Verrucomicrobiota bacterium]